MISNDSETDKKRQICFENFKNNLVDIVSLELPIDVARFYHILLQSSKTLFKNLINIFYFHFFISSRLNLKSRIT